MWSLPRAGSALRYSPLHPGTPPTNLPRPPGTPPPPKNSHGAGSLLTLLLLSPPPVRPLRTLMGGLTLHPDIPLPATATTTTLYPPSSAHPCINCCEQLSEISLFRVDACSLQSCTPAVLVQLTGCLATACNKGPDFKSVFSWQTRHLAMAWGTEYLLRKTI